MHLKKFLSGLMLTILVACGGDNLTTTNEPVNEAPPPAPQAQATPAPQQVSPTPSPSGPLFELWGEQGGTIKVKNNGSGPATIRTYYTSFDNQELEFGSQEGQINAGDTLSRSFPVSECFQGDAEAVPGKIIGGVFFDKDGKPFNPTKNPEKVTECRTTPCVPTWGEWTDVVEEQTAQCSKQQVRVQTCTGAKEYRTVDAPRPASYSLGSLSYPTYNSGSPAVKVGGYEFGNNSNGNRDACEDNGGTWYHSLKFCQIAKHFGNTWDDDENLPGKDEPQSDGTWRDAFTITPAVPASGGNPISGSATVSNAGTFKLVLKATNPGNHDKDVDEKTLTCGQNAKLSVSYNWIGHNSDDWFLQLYLNGTLVATSAVVNNPSN